MAKRGRKKGTKLESTTIWLKGELEKAGVDVTALLAKAIVERDFDMVEALTRLVPHIANKPKESHGFEGISGLIVKDFKPEEGTK